MERSITCTSKVSNSEHKQNDHYLIVKALITEITSQEVWLR